jgi:hypothetical protein
LSIFRRTPASGPLRGTVGAGRVFDLLVTNRILGFKKMIALQEIDEDYPEKQQKLIKI